MKYISHRGNTNGPNINLENNPKHILNVLNKFEVEIDVWYKADNFLLGHDNPIYRVEKQFLKNDGLWCHAKNYRALLEMLDNNIHCFWHQEDKYTLTSKGFIWAYPSDFYENGVIAVLPENNNVININNCAGICSDYIEDFK